MERPINTRLMWHLGGKQHISPEQAAFRQDRSTEDQVTYIAQAIEDAFQDKRHILVVSIDLETTFDKVWREGLKLKMRQCGIAGRMFKWISRYLHSRKARAQIKHHQNRKQVSRHGIPQGGVLSPTLFLIFIKDIIDKLPKNVQGAIYADDLALWCSEEYVPTADYRLQLALQVMETGTRSWLVKISEKKTIYTISLLSAQQHIIKLKISSQELHSDDSPAYLGLTLDRRMT